MLREIFHSIKFIITNINLMMKRFLFATLSLLIILYLHFFSKGTFRMNIWVSKSSEESPREQKNSSIRNTLRSPKDNEWSFTNLLQWWERVVPVGQLLVDMHELLPIKARWTPLRQSSSQLEVWNNDCSLYRIRKQIFHRDLQHIYEIHFS